ncbi:hypothetical protein ABFS83_09G083100 [Erythranthe nasuta]
MGEMDKHKADPDTQNNGKRKRKQGIDNAIDKLPDDLLTAIVSCMSIKDAVRTSVLSHRWRYLWMFTHGVLEFDERDISSDKTVLEFDNIMSNKTVRDFGYISYHKTRRKRYKFNRMVNHVLNLHQGTSVDSLIVRFCNKIKAGYPSYISEWVLFAVHKKVKRFDLDLSVPGGSPCNYKFPDLVGLLTKFPLNEFVPLYEKSMSFVWCLRSLNVFLSLRSVRLVSVDIKDEVVRYFLDSCPYIEKLCIRGSAATKDVKFVDPLPYLKVLEISECCNIQSLVISVKNLASCAYEGNEISLPFKNVPNLSELTLGGVFCESFIYEPNKHSSYSAQLVKLVLNLQTASVGRQIPPRIDLPQLHALKRLELSIVSQVGRSLLFLTSLIKASPQLHEFKMKINYLVPCSPFMYLPSLIPFPEVSSVEANVFDHNNLKVVEIDGYCGCASEDEFIAQMCSIAATSLETVIIDTDCDYYRDHPNYKYILVIYKPRQDGKLPMMKGVKKGKRHHEDPTENGQMNPVDAKKHADRFVSSFPSSGIKFIVR